MNLHLPVQWWAGFLVLIFFFLALDLGLFRKNKGAHVVSFKEAITWSGIWITLALAFNGFVHYQFGVQAAKEFLAGYLLEYALSVDNLFVFVLVFQAFRVPPKLQHRVLIWGILGALVMRAIFIGAGITLIQRFHWVTYLFGVLLIFTALKLLRDILKGGEKHLNPEDSWFLRMAKRVLPCKMGYDGDHFFVKENGKTYVTQLFLVLLVIESTDVIFAIDSIPAVLGVTQEPFIVFTSNVFAILGLRSLYFALSGIIQKFHYLQHALTLILAFVGFKMVLVDYVKIPIEASLGVIVSSLVLAVIASMIWVKKHPEA